MKIYDVIVIGSGAANIYTDAAVQAGKKVALIERGHLGGTCLNHGCIPTKILCTVADILEQSRRYERLGIKSQALEGDWAKVKERVFHVIETQRAGLDTYYESMKGLDLYRGTAQFTDHKTLAVKDDMGETIATLKAPTILIATGSRSRIPDMPGMDEIDYLTAESFFDRATYPSKPPQSLLLVGGGPIGVEFAHIFEAFGTKVTIVQRNVRLVPKSDEDVSAAVERAFATRDIHSLFNQETLSVKKGGAGVLLEVRDKKTDEIQTLTAETIFFSAGVVSANTLLHAERSGIKLDERGWIPTNEYLETNVPGIFAIGDANGRQQLRHKANYEAEILWHNHYVARKPEEWRAADYRYAPYVTYTSPQTAQVGLTEAQLKEQGIPYEVSTLGYSETAKGMALGYEDPDEAFVKVLLEPETEKILGVHIVGAEASILIQGYVYLLEAGKDRAPFLGEVISEEGKKARAAEPEHYQANQAAAVTHAMTAHPSLGEVSAWAFSWNRWDQGKGTP